VDGALSYGQGASLEAGIDGSRKGQPYRAARSGARKSVQLLISKGADVGAKDEQGNTPLQSVASGATGREFIIDVGQLNSYRL